VTLAARPSRSIGLGTAPLAFRDIGFDQAVATIRAAIEAGVRLVDTAPAYTRIDVESFAEAAIASALAGTHDRRTVTIATKGGHRRVGDSFPIDASAAALVRDCEVSLRALDVEAIDLYQLHHVDPRVPIEDSVAVLRDLQLAGKIATIGLCNVDVEQVRRAMTVAAISTVQNRFSVDCRADRPTVDYCAENSITYLAYKTISDTSRRSSRSAVDALARRLGVSPQRVRVAWVLSQGAHVVPLIGASRPETIKDSLGAADIPFADVESLRRADQEQTDRMST
jgi:aryl-alcohol dehydrogenase-like predicted oxidoreductase